MCKIRVRLMWFEGRGQEAVEEAEEMEGGARASCLSRLLSASLLLTIVTVTSS